MTPYLQTEFLNTNQPDPAIILAGAPIPFDNQLNDSDVIEYDMLTNRFKIKMAGNWIVNWFVAQQTGLSHEGSNFGCVIFKPVTDSLAPNYGDVSDPQIITGSGQVKIAPSSGFAVINVTELDVATPVGGVLFELQNVSSHDATLSIRTQVKAGLAVHCFFSEAIDPGGNDKDKIINAVANILASIALEEASIAHILNAEGEKIQKIIAVSDNSDELVAVNNSVRDLVVEVTEFEKTLLEKLTTVEKILQDFITLSNNWKIEKDD